MADPVVVQLAGEDPATDDQNVLDAIVAHRQDVEKMAQTGGLLSDGETEVVSVVQMHGEVAALEEEVETVHLPAAAASAAAALLERQRAEAAVLGTAAPRNHAALSAALSRIPANGVFIGLATDETDQGLITTDCVGFGVKLGLTGPTGNGSTFDGLAIAWKVVSGTVDGVRIYVLDDTPGADIWGEWEALTKLHTFEITGLPEWNRGVLTPLDLDKVMRAIAAEAAMPLGLHFTFFGTNPVVHPLCHQGLTSPGMFRQLSGSTLDVSNSGETAGHTPLVYIYRQTGKRGLLPPLEKLASGLEADARFGGGAAAQVARDDYAKNALIRTTEVVEDSVVEPVPYAESELAPDLLSAAASFLDLTDSGDVRYFEFAIEAQEAEGAIRKCEVVAYKDVRTAIAGEVPEEEPLERPDYLGRPYAREPWEINVQPGEGVRKIKVPILLKRAGDGTQKVFVSIALDGKAKWLGKGGTAGAKAYIRRAAEQTADGLATVIGHPNPLGTMFHAPVDDRQLWFSAHDELPIRGKARFPMSATPQYPRGGGNQGRMRTALIYRMLGLINELIPWVSVALDGNSMAGEKACADLLAYLRWLYPTWRPVPGYVSSNSNAGGEFGKDPLHDLFTINRFGGTFPNAENRDDSLNYPTQPWGMDLFRQPLSAGNGYLLENVKYRRTVISYLEGPGLLNLGVTFPGEAQTVVYCGKVGGSSGGSSAPTYTRRYIWRDDLDNTEANEIEVVALGGSSLANRPRILDMWIDDGDPIEHNGQLMVLNRNQGSASAEHHRVHGPRRYDFMRQFKGAMSVGGSPAGSARPLPPELAVVLYAGYTINEATPNHLLIDQMRQVIEDFALYGATLWSAWEETDNAGTNTVNSYPPGIIYALPHAKRHIQETVPEIVYAPRADAEADEGRQAILWAASEARYLGMCPADIVDLGQAFHTYPDLPWVWDGTHPPEELHDLYNRLYLRDFWGAAPAEIPTLPTPPTGDDFDWDPSDHPWLPDDPGNTLT